MNLEITRNDVEMTNFNTGDERFLCSLFAGGRRFGIDTRKIREVLGNPAVQAVPLAPRYLGGIVPYRGDVLTAVDLRALLGLSNVPATSCVLVLDDPHEDGRYGLIVDSVGGVIAIEQRSYSLNPTTLEDLSQVIFDGVYRLPDGLLIHLDPARLSPSQLRQSLRLAAGDGMDPWSSTAAAMDHPPSQAENSSLLETACTH